MKECLQRIVNGVKSGYVDNDDVLYVRNNSKDLLQLDRAELRGFFSEMLCSEDIENSLKILVKSGFLFEIFPEFKDLDGLKQPSKYHDYDVLRHILCATCYSENDLALRLTMLFHDIGKKETCNIDETGKITFYGHGIKGAGMASRMLNRLGYDKKIIEEVCLYIQHHMDYAPTEKSFNKMLKEFSNDLGKVSKLLSVKLCDKYACKGKDSEIAKQAEEEFKNFKTFLDKYKR